MIPRRRVRLAPGDLSAWGRALLWLDVQPGIRVREFERAFACFHACRHAHATASGREALLLALGAVGVRSGDEVVVPAITLGELLPLLRTAGYVPVAVDVEADTFNMDVHRLERHLGPRVRAILATHLLGGPCDIEAICDVARERGIAVVEDCAHALGASVGGRRVGTFGDAGIFSFEVAKAVPTYGGGMITTDRDDVSKTVAEALSNRSIERAPALERALTTWVEEALIRSPLYGPTARVLFSERFRALVERTYRNTHDRQRPHEVAYSDFQARIGLGRLDEVEQRNARLNCLADQLTQRLPSGLDAARRDVRGTPAFYQFVVRSRRMAPVELRRGALALGLDVGVGSEVMDDCGALLQAPDCPVAAEVCRSVVLLPLYDGLGARRFERLVEILQLIVSSGETRGGDHGYAR